MRVLVFVILSLLSPIVIAQIPTSPNIAPLNGTWLYNEMEGQGEAVVFIHGMALDSRMWDLQWKTFTKKFKVIRYDVRGFGQSGRAHDPHNPTEDLKALLDYLKIEKAHLIGHSMGGNIALNFAAKYPERVNKIVTVDATLDGFDNYTPEFKATLDRIVEIASHQGWHDEQQEVWLRSPLMRLYAADDRTLINLSEMTADYHGDHFINPRINPNFGQSTTVQLLPSIKANTLVVVGEKDEESLQRIGQLLSEKIPHNQKEIIKGAGHLPNMDKPKVFNKIVLKFLK